MNEQPFENGFEEMIQWTKEGKLWEFPVNNEAGKPYFRSSEQFPPAGDYVGRCSVLEGR